MHVNARFEVTDWELSASTGSPETHVDVRPQKCSHERREVILNNNLTLTWVWNQILSRDVIIQFDNAMKNNTIYSTGHVKLLHTHTHTLLQTHSTPALLYLTLNRNQKCSAFKCHVDYFWWYQILIFSRYHIEVDNSSIVTEMNPKNRTTSEGSGLSSSEMW